MEDAEKSLEALRISPSEETLWNCIRVFQQQSFLTFSGLPFSYTLRRGKHGEYTKELWIDRREDSKSLVWSSVVLAFHPITEFGAVVERPKALGDIRGVSYIYGIFYQFGRIDVPEKAKEKMRIQGNSEEIKGSKEK